LNWQRGGPPPDMYPKIRVAKHIEQTHPCDPREANFSKSEPEFGV
jgi:hypothetical protein